MVVSGGMSLLQQNRSPVIYNKCCQVSHYLGNAESAAGPMSIHERPLAKRICIFFFFNDTATTEIYTLSLHDALPILRQRHADETAGHRQRQMRADRRPHHAHVGRRDRKSTRLNSSHLGISYAVFCLKKKKQQW